MGGRLGGWGVVSTEEDGEEQEAFMAGVTDMVCRHMRLVLIPVLGSWKYGTIHAFRWRTTENILDPVRKECYYHSAIAGKYPSYSERSRLIERIILATRSYSWMTGYWFIEVLTNLT
jgi:hypothetical protein